MNYQPLLHSKTKSKWERIGVKRRAGVALPLFSVYSKNSIGTGEIPDLRIMIDWCVQTGMSIIQLLPLNELGYDNAPYNSISTFALEPMYLSLKKLRKADIRPFRKEIRKLKKDFPAGKGSVNYDVKKVKIEILRKIFETINTNNVKDLKKFNKFTEENFHWLKYYCVFKILKDLNNDKSWTEWDFKYKYIASFTAEKILKNYEKEVRFYCWVQWQLYEQMITIKKYAKRKNVFLMGDIPFLVSRNSADVWAYKNYFKLQLSAGAPPDMYFSTGQRWGMPPYNWDNIVADNYSYIRQKLKYAENFYDMYRIDHFVGLFRVWTIDLKTPPESGGMTGNYDPDEEKLWEQHGRYILEVMNSSTSMLPCAEDLGTVPVCSEKVLKEFGVTGINVQRWEKIYFKNRSDKFEFINSEDYRINSVATVSTHDSSSFPAWWENEAGTIDEFLFRQTCKKFNVSDENYFKILNALFSKDQSVNGRLFWNKDISSEEKLLNILGLNREEGKEFGDMYNSSFSEKKKFLEYLGLKKEIENNVTVNLIKASLEKISSASSIFSIQLIMEYLYLDESILKNYKGWEQRINFPGTVSENNWSMVIPVSIEKLQELSVNKILYSINKNSERI
ncbi:MAG TPA: 4-alpha-glucanotransferase [Ignavibacteria bacterium]|nr:4-alpha-glucanotransferase [Ignavibacteria bacterium]